jgi:hypothetical protein
MAHPLDEYLQALYLQLGTDRIGVELDLTLGVLVGPQVVSLIDSNGDGQISQDEAQTRLAACPSRNEPFWARLRSRTRFCAGASPESTDVREIRCARRLSRSRRAASRAPAITRTSVSGDPLLWMGDRDTWCFDFSHGAPHVAAYAHNLQEGSLQPVHLAVVGLARRAIALLFEMRYQHIAHIPEFLELARSWLPVSRASAVTRSWSAHSCES